MRTIHITLFVALTGALGAAAADNPTERLQRSISVLDMHGVKSEKRRGQFAAADCVAVIPGFKKGAAVIGIGYGRGFLSCRQAGGWSAPAAVSLETSSLGVQVGGEAIDIVVLFLDGGLRGKLLSGRFTIGSDASAAWGNGKSAHEDSNVKVLFFGHTKGVFAGFGLDGASLSADDSSNKALYGKSVTNRDVIEGGTDTPSSAQPFVAKLSSVSGH